jgi:type VI secretion system secreted protein Hcp
VFEIEHHLHQPVEPTTGQASGVRVHSPFRIVKLIDKATPGFHKALCTGQNLKEVTVHFYRIDPESREEKEYYNIKLRQARIVDIRPYMPMSFVPANESYRHMEQVSMVYEEIEWNFKPTSAIEMDKWRAPGGA